MRYIILTLSLLIWLAAYCPTWAAQNPSSEKFVEFDKPPQPIGGMNVLADSVKYPDSAKKEKIEGKVIVAIYINENGIVEKTEIKQSVRDDLDNAAVNSLTAMKWSPAEQKGKPVAVWVSVPIQFKLDDKKKK